ncbi:MAG: Flp pilus assembly complex ATPase component TadA [Candidatus Eremiobacteraeota bacterium]|nr:Flp pilus assembly complex ATPase component TadA [Candidatus Eremiobacteraeota bacterium]
MDSPVFFMVGSKGGVGTTTLAIDMAKHLASRGATLLVDADLSGRRSEAVIFNAIRKIDEAQGSQDLPAIEVANNLRLLEIASNVHAGFMAKADRLERFIAESFAGTQYTIVDSAQPFAAAVRPFAVRAAQFVLIVEPSMLGVTGARATQLELSRFGVPESYLCAVIGAPRNGKAEISHGDIEKALHMPVAGEIPLKSDRKYDRAVSALAQSLTAKRSEGLLTLQPSTNTPLGERRLGRRAPQPGVVNASQPADSTADPAATSSENRIATTSRLRGDLGTRLKFKVQQELARRIDFAAMTESLSPDALKLEELRTEIAQIVAQIVQGEEGVGSAEEIAQFRQELIDEALGLGPLESILADEEITEIMVNGPDDIYMERKGQIVKSERQFTDSRQLRLVIERIISPIGRHIDEASPMVDARLADGSRVNATIEPLSIDGPTLTIRRFGKRTFDIRDLTGLNSLTPAMADLLRAAVEARLNIVVSGGTGSGKTTLLNVLSTFCPGNERIITIEDAAELRLSQEHVVRLETRPPNTEGRGEIRIRELVRNSLRMRPDRIIVGECRGGEALDMLQAMNTGHDGSLTTIHANTPRDCVRRLETMVLMAGFDMPMRAIREQIASAVDVIVQTSRMRDGSRKVTSVAEVVGMEGEVITMQEIMRFQSRGLDKENKVAGSFVFSGVRPTFLERFKEYGVSYDISRLNEMERESAAV